MCLGYPWLFSLWKAWSQRHQCLLPLLTETHTKQWLAGCHTLKKEGQIHQSTHKMPVLSSNRGCCGYFVRFHCILGKQMVFNKHLTLSMNWRCVWPYYVYVITHYICIYSRAVILYLEEVSPTCMTMGYARLPEPAFWQPLFLWAHHLYTFKLMFKDTS